jgi:hypothetical protein
VEKLATALLITVLLILWSGCHLRRAKEKIREKATGAKEVRDGPV